MHTRNLHGAGVARLELVQQDDLRRRAAHVERDGARRADLPRHVLAENGAACGAGLNKTDRKSPRRLDRGQRSTRHDHQKRRGQAHGAQALGQAAEIGGDQGLHIGVGDRGRGALVFADFRTDLMRDADIEAGRFLEQDVARARLVGGIAVAMNEGNRDGFDMFVAQARGDGAHRVLVQRHQHGPVGRHALGHVDAQGARRERLGTAHQEIVLVEAMAEGEFERVAKARGRQQRRARAAPLDDGVGGERRAVNGDLDIAGRDAGARENLADAREHAALRRIRRRQHLVGHKTDRRLKHDVGEGAANIDSQATTRHSIPRGSRAAALARRRRYSGTV